MIGTIRKHSSWLMVLIVVLTILSFLIFMGKGGGNTGGPRNTGYGTLYGKAINAQEFEEAKAEFFIYYLRQTGQFPDHKAMSNLEIERETYIRLLLKGKADQLGIHVSDEAVQAEAINFLNGLGRDGRVPKLTDFIEQALQPEGLTAGDFQRYLANELRVEQMIRSLGLFGALMPPQEAADLYDHQNQTVSAQAIFFSGSNYLSQIAVSPAQVGAFFTNYMAHYRLPDRVQIDYVQFDLTNYLTAAEAKAGKTNLTMEVDAEYAKRGMEGVPDAKSADDAKAKIRQMILRRDAASMAAAKAMDFVKTLFAMEPVSPANLATLALSNGIAVHTTAPFSEVEGPAEFAAPTELTKQAFLLNEDSPFSRPIGGAESVYVIGLNKRLPSAVPSFSDIQSTVTRDVRDHEGAIAARTASTNFYYSATVQMAAGNDFAKAATAAGQKAVTIKPFSLNTREVPEAEGHLELKELQSIAFGTPPGHMSPPIPTPEGAIVLYVKSLVPVDASAKTSALPGFMAQLRRGREQEAFNIWLQTEATREFRSLPNYDELLGRKTAAGGS